MHKSGFTVRINPKNLLRAQKVQNLDAEATNSVNFFTFLGEKWGQNCVLILALTSSVLSRYSSSSPHEDPFPAVATRPQASWGPNWGEERGRSCLIPHEDAHLCPPSAALISFIQEEAVGAYTSSSETFDRHINLRAVAQLLHSLVKRKCSFCSAVECRSKNNYVSLGKFDPWLSRARPGQKKGSQQIQYVQDLLDGIISHSTKRGRWRRRTDGMPTTNGSNIARIY